ncbi:FtsX-like permease family protein [Butyrivibrio sp. INlla16]|nr:FtsX-like permease family protein [Butyrivibrio sp. INlla16]
MCMFKVVGGLLTSVLALIGILNLINTLVTSVLSRRLELAMLEAVGMTKRIQRTSICFEGIVYGGLALIFGMILSSAFSVLLVKSIGMEMWFYTYRFTLMPIMIVTPVILMVAMIIPVVIYSRTMKETVVERLRLADA